MEHDEADPVASSGTLLNSMEELVAEGIVRTVPVPDGQNLNLD